MGGGGERTRFEGEAASREVRRLKLYLGKLRGKVVLYVYVYGVYYT